ncbi:TMV resistance protein N [Trifolium repens]|jgi:ribonuclease HI|nr:TMV resistance protein N [Trifolium repens]
MDFSGGGHSSTQTLMCNLTQYGNLASCGGVLIDDSGNFLYVFASKLRPCVVLEAELWGILIGLKMAWNRGLIKVFSDSLNVVTLLNGNCSPTHRSF